MPRRLRRAWGSVEAGLRPRPLPGGDGACRRIRRGRPACRPVGGSRAEVPPGGHIGPPLHGVEGIPNQRKIGAKTDLANGAGQSPPPTGATEQGGLRRGAPGVWLPPAKFRNGIWGVSHGHPALRGARGRHAGVVVPYGRQLPLHKGAFGTGCCGSLQSSPNSRRNSASSWASLSSRAWVPARDSIWWVSSWARVSRSSRRQSSSLQSSRSARAAKDP